MEEGNQNYTLPYNDRVNLHEKWNHNSTSNLKTNNANKQKTETNLCLVSTCMLFLYGSHHSEKEMSPEVELYRLWSWKNQMSSYSEVNHSSRQDHCPIPMVHHCHLTALIISKKMLYNANRCLGILSSQIQGQNYSSVHKILINRRVPIFLHDPHIWKSELRKHGVSTNHGLSRESWMKNFFQIRVRKL